MLFQAKPPKRNEQINKENARISADLLGLDREISKLH